MVERFYNRCGDCGQDFKERSVSKRRDICDECWERRCWLVAQMKVGNLPLDRFQKIQRSMAYHRGTAKRQIIKLQHET